jgi:hypothetical protein
MIGPGYYQTCGQMLNESGASSSGSSSSGPLRVSRLVLYFLLVSGILFFGGYMLDRCLTSSIQNKQIEVIDTNNLQYNTNTHYNYHLR